MAKAKQSNTSATDDVIMQLIQQHNKISPGSAMLGEDLESEITTWISSGSLLLDLILSNKEDGGWPCGRVIQVFGQESIGKSTLSYVAIANCQKQGGIVIYADAENGANKKFMSMLDIDLKRMIWCNTDTVEDLFQALEDNLKLIINTPSLKGKPVLVIIDSIAALQTKSEVENNYEANMNISLAKAKQLHKAFRKINSFVTKANACLFAIDQIKENTTGYGPKWTLSGGKALAFFSSIRLYLEGKKRIEAKDPTIENEFLEATATWKAAGGNKAGIPKPERPKTDTVTIGFEISAVTIKNKTAPPERTAHFRILFAEGLRDEECYLDYLVKYGAAKQSGAYFEIVGWKNEHGKFYKSSWIEDVLSDADTYKKVIEFLKSKLIINIKDGAANYITVATDVDINEEKELLSKAKQFSNIEKEEMDSDDEE